MLSGKQVEINGLDYTIAGVTPQAFIGTEVIFTPEFFVPLAMLEQIGQAKWMDDRGDTQGWANRVNGRGSIRAD